MSTQYNYYPNFEHHSASLTPRQIVAHLDQYIVGQYEAKKAIANAFRNRWRRSQISGKIKDEVGQNNIIMIGQTGIGKTAIAKRAAQLYNMPCIKVEATKFTEIGFVGKDVDSIIRDLIEVAITQTKQQKRKEVKAKVESIVENKIIEALAGTDIGHSSREVLREQLRKGELDDREIEIAIEDNPASLMQNLDFQGGQMGVLNLGELFKGFGGKKSKLVKMPIKIAYENINKEESDKLLDETQIINEAITKTENDGIVIIDELDKIASKNGGGGGGGSRAEISREGVQRDLLPLVEGTTVNTKYGPICTDHILFIGLGAFQWARPSDLLPELQGRFPVRVELSSLTQSDMLRIITEPEHNLIKQYQALLAVEKLEINFTNCALEKIAEIAYKMNIQVENIGARRLRTILDKVMEEICFTANEKQGEQMLINAEYINEQLKEFLEDKDNIRNFIL